MLVVVGCVIAGVGDLAFDAGAYIFAFSSVIMQALYLLLVEFQVN
jgi:solute carrier family 35 protein